MMIDTIDLLILLSLSTLVSTYTITSACVNCAEIPWFTVIFKPIHFGGFRKTLRNFICLVTWIIIGYLWCFFILYVLLAMNDLILSYTNQAEASFPYNKQSPVIAVLTVAFYALFIDKTRNITKQNDPSGNSSREPQQSTLQSNKPIELGNNFTKNIGIVWNFIPSTLYPLYRFFYKQKYNLIYIQLPHLLLYEFKHKIAIPFYKHIDYMIDDCNLCKSISTELKNNKSVEKRAAKIYTLCVVTLGYSTTRNLLLSYRDIIINFDQNDGSYIKRKKERNQISRRKELTIMQYKQSFIGEVIDYCVDGSALAINLSSDKHINKDQEVYLTNTEVNAKGNIIYFHTESRQTRSRRIAINIPAENDKENLISFLSTT